MGYRKQRFFDSFFSSDPREPLCHRVRIVLAEKGVTRDVIKNVEARPTHPEELRRTIP